MVCVVEASIFLIFIVASSSFLSTSRGSVSATEEMMRIGLSDAIRAAIESDEKLAVEFISVVDMLFLLTFEGRKALSKVRKCRRWMGRKGLVRTLTP